MKRRDVVTLAAGAVIWPVMVRAQHRERGLQEQTRTNCGRGGGKPFTPRGQHDRCHRHLVTPKG
jgi:hypothetical protein